MHKAKTILAHGKHVLNGILLLGFGIQIILGVVWMCSNFARAPHIMYVLQLAVGLGIRYLFLRTISPEKKWFAVCGALALLTFPFSMQCHLSLQPFSFMSSVFYAILFFAYKGFRLAKEGVWHGKKRGLAFLGLALSLCLFMFLAGSVDKASEDSVSGRGWEARLASRMAWPTLWIDMEPWSEELREIAPPGVVWEAAFSPDNMSTLLDHIEEEVGEEKAAEYYLEMARVAWSRRKPSILRQMAWDTLGYGVTPIIVPLQLSGEAYDSYTGTNYGLMMEHTPRLTGCYVAYACWWFACTLGYILLAGSVRCIQIAKAGRNIFTIKGFGKTALFLGFPLLFVAVLVMRGSGMMDYRLTVAVNELWLLCALKIATGE